MYILLHLQNFETLNDYDPNWVVLVCSHFKLSHSVNYTLLRYSKIGKYTLIPQGEGRFQRQRAHHSEVRVIL